MMMALKAAAQQQGAIPTTVYVEEDFTATTNGTDLSYDNLSVDELGNGWLGHAFNFDYQTDGSGVECTSTSGNRVTVVETDGREDVRVTGTFVAARTGATGRWQGFCCRSHGNVRADSLYVILNGVTSDADLRLIDDQTTLKTWDLSVLLGVNVAVGDHLVIVVDCSGNDITLVSIDRNGAGATAINETYTLTGGTATDHGAGSGADRYGLISNDRSASTVERFEYFKVESIPA